MASITLFTLLLIVVEYSLVLFSDATVLHDEETKFAVDGVLTCTIYSKWCYRVALVEVDDVKSDTLDEIGVICQDPNEWTAAMFYLNGTERGDGVLDNFFEIEVHLTHNCTDSGRIMLLKLVFPPIPVANREFKTSWKETITNNGLLVDSYFFDINHSYIFSVP